jgi:hypothetical protein
MTRLRDREKLKGDIRPLVVNAHELLQGERRRADAAFVRRRQDAVPRIRSRFDGLRGGAQDRKTRWFRCGANSGRCAARGTADSTCRASEMELTECGMQKIAPNVTPITILPVDYVQLFCGWSTPPCSGVRKWNLGPSLTTLGTGVSAQKKLVVARIK